MWFERSCVLSGKILDALHVKQGSDSDAKGVEAVKAVNDVRKRRSDWIDSNVLPPFLLKIHSTPQFFHHFLLFYALCWNRNARDTKQKHLWEKNLTTTGLEWELSKAKADISVSESSGSRNRSCTSYGDLPTQNRGNETPSRRVRCLAHQLQILFPCSNRSLIQPLWMEFHVRNMRNAMAISRLTKIPPA